jgi:hypothetical protein
MKQEDNLPEIGNQSQQSAGLAGQIPPQANQNDSEIDEPSVSLLDRAVAALILIIPFGLLIDLAQTKLLAIVSESIAHMAVLVGIILFLVATGRLSKTIYYYRLKVTGG